jgi:RNA polymerase sigma factor (sigma-70 family)
MVQQQQHGGWPEARVLRGLVQEAQRGIPNAVNALLAALRPALVAFFSRRLSNDVAEDFAQSALLRIAGALPRIDPERADSYVSTVARNLLRTAYRRRVIDQRRHSDTELSSLISDTEPIEAWAEYKEFARAVQRVVRTGLPEPLAEVILSLLHGETTSEIAERLGLSPITVRTRLLRARAILRRELLPYMPGQASRECRNGAERRTDGLQSAPG